jgi:hypothetical protein
LACPVGYQCLPGQSPQSCVAGQYSAEAERVCQDCQLGTYSSFSSRQCSPCPANHQCSNLTLGPVPCADGTWSTGRTSLDWCWLCALTCFIRWHYHKLFSMSRGPRMSFWSTNATMWPRQLCIGRSSYLYRLSFGPWLPISHHATSTMP